MATLSGGCIADTAIDASYVHEIEWCWLNPARSKEYETEQA